MQVLIGEKGSSSSQEMEFGRMAENKERSQSSLKNLSCKRRGYLGIFIVVAFRVAAVQALETSSSGGNNDFTIEFSSNNPDNWQETHHEFVKTAFQKHFGHIKTNLPPDFDLSILDGTPFAQMFKCTVAEDKLIGLKDAIENALDKAGQNLKAHGCAPDASQNSQACSEIIKVVECGVSILKQGYEQAIQKHASADEIDKWRNAYEGLIQESREKLDAIRLNLDQRYAKDIETLRTSLQEKESELTKQLEELCIKYIDSMDISAALSEFKKLTSSTGGICAEHKKLNSVVKEVYYRAKDTNIVENIVKFIQLIPCCPQQEIGYETLYDLLRKNNHLHRPILLILSKAVEESGCINVPSKGELAKHSEEIMNKWADQMRKNDGKSIYEFEKTYRSVINYYLDKIMKKSYSNTLENANNMLLFIRGSQFIETSGKALSSLFDNMQANNHLDSYELVKLAYRVKEYMNMPNYSNLKQEDKNVFEKLKNNLPAAVRGLIWYGSSCTIKNRHHNEYLHAAGRNHSLDSGRGRIITWKPGGEDREAYWDIETNNNAESFTLRNTHNDTYIYAADQTKDELRRWVLHWWPGGRDQEGFWKILPVDGGTAFKLKSMVHGGPNEYLYADGNLDHSPEKDGHGVFAWRVDGGPINFETHWYINC